MTLQREPNYGRISGLTLVCGGGAFIWKDDLRRGGVTLPFAFPADNLFHAMNLGKHFKVYHKPADNQRPFSLVVENRSLNEVLFFESGVATTLSINYLSISFTVGFTVCLGRLGGIR